MQSMHAELLQELTQEDTCTRMSPAYRIVLESCSFEALHRDGVRVLGRTAVAILKPLCSTVTIDPNASNIAADCSLDNPPLE